MVTALTVKSIGTVLPSALDTETDILNVGGSESDRGWFCGFVSLKNLQIDDTVDIKIYITIDTESGNEVHSIATISGVQTIPAWYMAPLPSFMGLRLTVTQTAGATLRSFDYVIYKG